MRISGIAKHSLVDYPGHIACVLFTPGCNYDCFYCHNRPLLRPGAACLPMGQIDAFLEKRKGLIEGVVLSGGEPTLQPGLLSYLRHLKGRGYKVKLDTNGSRPALVMAAVGEELVDYVAVDYKAPARRYREIAGADAAPVLETLGFLAGSGIPFEARTTLIPQLGEADLLAMAAEMPPLPRYTLNPYRPPADYPAKYAPLVAVPPHTPAAIRALVEKVRGVQGHVRG